ncbi:MAG: hypothetical protein GXO69_10635 [Acidobacteria bacterium]|nr:hypothetical protein [Acidobacteriota bacterium]
MRKPAPFIITLFFLAALNGTAREHRYTYQFEPIATPLSFVLGKRVIISSKGVTVSLEQIHKPDFADKFEIFQAEPDIYFFYFKITIRNRSGQPLEVNPIFFSALDDRREFRKPLNYDQLYRMLGKMYPESEFKGILEKELLDFCSPIRNGDEKTAILIFRNFREKGKKCIIKLDAMSMGGRPLAFSFPYNLKRTEIR